MSMKALVPVAALVLVTSAEARAHEGEPGHDHGVDDHDPPSLPPAASGAEEDPDPELGDVAGLAIEDESLEDEQAAPPPDEPKPRVPPPERPGDTALDRTQTIPDTSWRRSTRGQYPTTSGWFDPIHFLAELRFGPYSPQVDDEESLTGTPYADYFGTEPKFYFGLEIDWLPLYVPYVASIGPAFGWGFTSASGNTRLAEDPTQEADSETSLTIFPMHVSLVARFDGLLREVGIPIVPYGKLGLGWGIWSVSAPSDNSVDGVSADGASYGMHAAVGGSIALNAFDRAAAMTMRADTGIRYAHLYGEWMGDFLGDIGPEGQMRVGTSTVVVGVSIEF